MLKTTRKQTNKKDYLKKEFGQKGNELSSWDGKKIICNYSLLKECFKTIIIVWVLGYLKKCNIIRWVGF